MANYYSEYHSTYLPGVADSFTVESYRHAVHTMQTKTELLETWWSRASFYQRCAARDSALALQALERGSKYMAAIHQQIAAEWSELARGAMGVEC